MADEEGHGTITKGKLKSLLVQLDQNLGNDDLIDEMVKTAGFEDDLRNIHYETFINVNLMFLKLNMS